MLAVQDGRLVKIEGYSYDYTRRLTKELKRWALKLQLDTNLIWDFNFQAREAKVFKDHFVPPYKQGF